MLKKGGVFMRVHLPSGGGMTMIENTFIDQLMPCSSGDFVKIYLYLMRCSQRGQSDVSVAQVADALNYTESDVTRAMGYWKKHECLDVVETEDEPSPAPVSQDTVSGGKITEFRASAKSTRDDLQNVVFVAENYLGRPLSQTEQNTLVYFLNDLGMDSDLIDYLLDYCISQNHTSFHYIKKVAQNWTSQGIRTVEQARREGSSFKNDYFSIFRTFGIQNHTPTPAEIEYMDRWMKDYALSMDVILEACRRTILQTGRAQFSYADSILQDWSRNKVASIEDVEALDRAHELSLKRISQEHAPALRTVSAGRFVNFTPSGTDWDDVAEKVMQAQEAQELRSQES